MNTETAMTATHHARYLHAGRDAEPAGPECETCDGTGVSHEDARDGCMDCGGHGRYASDQEMLMRVVTELVRAHPSEITREIDGMRVAVLPAEARHRLVLAARNVGLRTYLDGPPADDAPESAPDAPDAVDALAVGGPDACPACNGTGRVERGPVDQDDCAACDGTGERSDALAVGDPVEIVGPSWVDNPDYIGRVGTVSGTVLFDSVAVKMGERSTRFPPSSLTRLPAELLMDSDSMTWAAHGELPTDWPKWARDAVDDSLWFSGGGSQRIHEFSVGSAGGREHGRSGDWLVRRPDGSLGIRAAEPDAGAVDPDRGRRLYEKFRVFRTDGSSAPGGKHDGCECFVLDMTHDVHAVPAIRAYADSCAADYPLLAADLRAKWLGSVADAGVVEAGGAYRTDGTRIWHDGRIIASSYDEDEARAITDRLADQHAEIERLRADLLLAESEQAEAHDHMRDAERERDADYRRRIRADDERDQARGERDAARQALVRVRAAIEDER